MRDLVVTENISLDGVVDLSGGWFAPATDSDDVTAAQREHMATSDATLLGRVTYEEFAGFWPARAAHDSTGIAKHLNDSRKYVVSSTLDNPVWHNTRVLRGPVGDEVAALKRVPGADIVATGSIRLVRSLVAAGLVDEYRLFVYPVVCGTGERLFADATGMPVLRLVQARPFRSGVVLLRYRAGA